MLVYQRVQGNLVGKPMVIFERSGRRFVPTVLLVSFMLRKSHPSLLGQLEVESN